MNLLLAIAAGVLILGMGQKRVASAGGTSSAAKRKAALRRLPPHLRAKVEAKARAKVAGRAVEAGGISRGVVRSRPPVHAFAPPWLPDEVDAALLELLNAGVRDPDVLTTRTLREIYPVTDDGAPIPWPTVERDSAGLRALEERVRLRAVRHLSTLADIEADELLP